jgi:cytidine deaminase
VTGPDPNLTDTDQAALAELAKQAWDVRSRARILGNTAVGCAVMAADGSIHVGCNVEHRFRSHDIHAEVNAISTMITRGAQDLRMVVVAAERDRFSPCGACLDWIFEFGGTDCLVAWQPGPTEPVVVLRADHLMPYYPG